MPIKPLSEEYKEASQSSISKLFFNYFKHEKPIDPIILESIDFSETFKKTTYVSEGRNRFILNIEESIAQNLVSSLPNEAFLPYITASWLQVSKDSSSNSNVISHLLYFQRYDVVKKFQDETKANIYIKDGILHIHPQYSEIFGYVKYNFSRNL